MSMTDCLPMRRRRGVGRASAIAAAFALLFTTAAFAEDVATTGAVPKEVTVTIDNFSFAPAELTIAPGTTVKFINHDDIPHSVLEAGGKFKSKVMDTDEDYSRTFDTAGEITYFCGLHPHMKGKIIVKPTS
jgi:plastocyanin